MVTRKIQQTAVKIKFDYTIMSKNEKYDTRTAVPTD